MFLLEPFWRAPILDNYHVRLYRSFTKETVLLKLTKGGGGGVKLVKRGGGIN